MVSKAKKKDISFILTQLKEIIDEDKAYSFLHSTLKSMDDIHKVIDINDNTLAHLFVMKHDFPNLRTTIKAYQDILSIQENKSELFYKWLTLENSNQNTIYEIISEHPQKEIMYYLFDIIKDRHDITYRLIMNRTNVFHLAIQASQIYSLIFFFEKFKPLIGSNNILNYGNAEGDTPLHKACHRNKGRMVDLLIQLGCDIDAINKAGNTPLITAVKVNSISIVKKLIINGGNVNVKGEDNKTAKDMAEYYGYQTLSNVLQPRNLFQRVFLCKKSYIALKNSSHLTSIYILFCIIFVSKGGILLLLSLLLNQPLNKGDRDTEKEIGQLVQCFIDRDNCYGERVVFLLGIIFDCISCFLIVTFVTIADQYYNKDDNRNKEQKEKEKEKSLIELLELKQKGQLCPICYKIKEYETLHCIVCNCCVEKWDHHCFWLGKCINEYNIKFFNIINFIAIIELLINMILSLEEIFLFALKRINVAVYKTIFHIEDMNIIWSIEFLFTILFSFVFFFLTVIFASLAYIIYMNCTNAKAQEQEEDNQKKKDKEKKKQQLLTV